jgi:replicative superfamily II helicase
MQINSIEDLANSPANIPENIVRTWQERYPDGLLPFQKQALSDESFWDVSKNIIIQGPTSAGKTFVGEVLAAKTFATETDSPSPSNCVYLVPYKAIVPDKFNTFKANFQEYKVFCSSSDFQGDDSEIGKGNYDLAVMVYEKLLAMLAEPNSKVLSRCELIVVDELQMIDDKQRGGKLEFILSRLLWEANYGTRRIRIVGLGGVGSDLSVLVNWLCAVKIQSGIRPVPLREGVYNLGGLHKYRLIGTEPNQDEDPREELENLQISAERKNNLVSRLTHKHLEENHKVIVFRGSRHQTVMTAENIAKRRSPLAVSEDVENELVNLEETEGSDQFKKLFRKGVIYHHSGLTTEERSLIEAEFSKRDGCIKVVVATETLAAGVNLPADVVILADKDRPAGVHGHQPITVESYRNCIGRAGRYGLSEQGFSYLLAEDERELDTLWRIYVKGSPTKIDSGLMNSLPKNLSDPSFKVAPFILNQIDNSRQGASKEDLKQFFEYTLIYSGNRISHFHNVLESSLDKLERQKLVVQIGEKWEATSKGDVVARSTISIGAYDAVSQLLENMRLWNGKFYAGDILFAICDCPEINESPYLGLIEREKANTLFLKKLWRSDMLTENVGVFPGSRLDGVIKDTVSPSLSDATKMKRAITLGLWMTGVSPLSISRKIAEISKKLQIDNAPSLSIDAGHLRSVGDVMGWLIESAANLSNKDDTLRSYEKPLRQFAARIQYGLPDSIIPIAKLQVKGLSRKLLMKLFRDSAKIEDQTWDDYILETSLSSFPLSKKLLDALREAVIDRNSRASIEGSKLHKRVIRDWIKDEDVDATWEEQIIKLYDEEIIGVSFEKILAETLIKLGLDCNHISQNQNAEPDFILKIRGKSVYGECKVSTDGGKRKKGKTFSWSEAGQILRAYPLYGEAYNRIVVAYDGFDPTVNELCTPHKLILLPLDAFAEACLWTLEKGEKGKMALENFFLEGEGHFSRREISDILSQYMYSD